jgi:glycosyltransferase involved in cell wall biosynthesis
LPELKILLLNQTFYPDVVTTAQHLADLALALKEQGHEVTVVTGRRAYDNTGKVFPARENWNSVRIFRVFSTSFGKRAKWRRAADFASFIFFCCGRLLFLPSQDLVVALTSPPLISFIAAWFTKLRGGKFCYWVMDLNPDEAIAANWLDPDSLAGRFLERMSRFSFRSATKIIALDRFMRDRILAKGIDLRKICVLPPWSHEGQVKFDEAGRGRFRAAHGLDGKFVVMYSGNHSPCHPLDTLLGAARQMRADAEVAFCFVGGGSEFKRVQNFKQEHGLTNILCLPYQPLDQLSASLSAADLHAVIMGEPFVGIVHPCKIYNILAIAAPVLYIGPEQSHLTAILSNGTMPNIQVRHGDIDRLVEEIGTFRKRSASPERISDASFESYSQSTLLPHFLKEIVEG